MLHSFVRSHPRTLRLCRPQLISFSSVLANKTTEFAELNNDRSSDTSVNSTAKYLAENQIILKGVPNQSHYVPMFNFEQLHLPSSIKSILRKEGFQSPTPIQAVAWPIVMDKRDVISVARTGSGT